MDRVFFLKNMSNRLTITYANDFSAQKYKKHLEYARILRKKCVFFMKIRQKFRFKHINE